MWALIIGAGSIGTRHAAILEGMGIGVHFVSRRKDLNNVVSSSIDGVLNLSIYDYFLICNESALHYDSLLKIIRNVYNKKVLIENPLFIDRLTLDVGSNKCYIGYNLRFHPVIKNAMMAIEKEKILNIDVRCNTYLPDWNPGRDYTKTYSAITNLGGGILKDVTHEIDLLYFITKQTALNEKKFIYEKISKLKIETNDYYRAIGKLGTVQFTMSLDYITRISTREIFISTDKKTLKLCLISSTLQISSDGEKLTKNYKVDRNDTYKEMHENILFNEGGSSSTFNDGLRVLEWF